MAYNFGCRAQYNLVVKEGGQEGIVRSLELDQRSGNERVFPTSLPPTYIFNIFRVFDIFHIFSCYIFFIFTLIFSIFHFTFYFNLLL